MKTALIGLFFFLVAGACVGESPSAKWQTATITEVKPHASAAAANSSAAQFDVTLRVGNAEYVVLYAPPDGTDQVRYRVGLERLVLVGNNTIKYNDLLGRTRDLPILRRQQVAASGVGNKPPNGR